MKAMTTSAREQPLSLTETVRAVRLQTEIGALREARECVTDGAVPDVLYGRIDDLIAQRRAALEALYTHDECN